MLVIIFQYVPLCVTNVWFGFDLLWHLSVILNSIRW